MEIFQKMVNRMKDENPLKFTGAGSLLGIGLLMGYLCLLHGKKETNNDNNDNNDNNNNNNSPISAEFLAIDDAPEQHRKLVQYYKRAGFQIIKYVGDGFQDIPDRMVWGGCGTLMREDIDTLLQRW
eukprot:CAMPEP_0202449254 /NCGR_PEP_ID=MMETSP1360-20130828/8000_1 /ASSEMBLY_ACC=CAM_ASM_000848 /TAXON_ID=515479 /ORGANISM="Licmophora paradoxa, Strain CCMP2313" /LENGTH=125 /DNA_ID=CAMNT_0049067119 /DNA_START=401 /DNA_END=775 /DNA_ORIENTATION=+